MSHQIFYHEGSDLTLSTRVKKGQLSIDDFRITILIKENIVQISLYEIKSVQLIRINKIGSVIRIEHVHGITFLSVVRFMFGQFAIVNFFATRMIFKRIQNAVGSEHAPS